MSLESQEPVTVVWLVSYRLKETRMSSCGRGHDNRGKQKKKPNRYNPNRPDYYEVHGTLLGGRMLNLVRGPAPLTSVPTTIKGSG